MKKIASIIASLLIAFGALFTTCAPVYADAFSGACDDPKIKENADLKKKLGCDEVKKDTSKNVIQFAVGVVVGLSGSVALIFIIIGGIHYMTANGDSNKIKKSKDMIMYSIIGLLICALAFAITNWIISILPS